MAYLIHFTTEDLARTKVTQAALPLMELDLAARALQDRSRPVRLDAWRQEARGRLSVHGRMALSLMPPVGWSPTFLDSSLNGSPEELLQQMRATPRRRIRSELELLVHRQGIPDWARQLPEERDLQEQLYQGMDNLWHVLLAPHWPAVTGVVNADRSLRMRQFAEGGVESVLAHTNPRWMRWKPPVLEIRMANGIDHDLHLGGRGILLAPSAFATRTLIEDDIDQQPILTYPAAGDQPLRQLTSLGPGAVSAAPPGLAALLGHTRSAVLYAIAEHPACSTKELAALVGIAPASASEHTTVLRGARLIETQRHRNSVLHTPTALGVALLNAQV
ncbi:winged helix-turn-helix domain-containing protein [Streptomyces sp. HPF1205]|uniref:winged helix-turn-helix domain-containing protein n=1 Tax=Streptomyces sp. HPF1205 TaxID=2873262 RepID=UPI001CED1488|nr:winged helix-turn-helix domain-containing protein [Streptomyces sp. HPF1205]